MITPWFPENYAWIFGASFGVLGALFGTLVGSLAPRGKARGFVFAFFWFCLICSLLCLVSGLIALFSKQPYGVWYGLTMAGGVGTLVFGVNYFTIASVYRQAEARKMAAQDL